MTESPDDNDVARIVAQAEVVSSPDPQPSAQTGIGNTVDGVGHEVASEDAEISEGYAAAAAGQKLLDENPQLREQLSACVELDHSDADNAKRLIAYFGPDLLVLKQDGIPGGDWLTWSGTHWDISNGAALAALRAQQVGDLISAEADVIAATPAEERAIADGKAAEREFDKLSTKSRRGKSGKEREREAVLKAAIVAGKEGREAVNQRRASRRKFGVSSKNAGRIKNMLELTAPHLRRSPDSFNPNPFLVATKTHTLRFVRELDEECPDPEVKRYTSRLEAIEGHRREDLITALVPFPFDPEATCPFWLEQMERFQPQPDKRRTVQQFAGVGLLGIPLQFFMYHYGLGANFKSGFLETLTKLLGESFAVKLPAESIIGGGAKRGAGQASPDLARLFGKRMIAIQELPDGEQLQEALIKRLTGGERIPVRTLFKGYFDFLPIGKPHMSGNGFPRLDGTDNGIRRRMLVVHWTETAPFPRRELDDVVADLLKEGSGILNWLIEGALDYLANGLVVAPDIRITTDDYFDDQDVIGQFIKGCVEAAPGISVGAREMFQTFLAWCDANAKYPAKETRFGREMKKRLKPGKSNGRSFYRDCRLNADAPSTRTPSPAMSADELVPC